MISIRGGMGLGDALYVQGVARHLVERGKRLEVCTAWPDVFRPLGDRVKCSPFRRNPIDRLAHYTTRRGAVGTTQFEDCCINAGVQERVDFRLDWTPVNRDLIVRLRSSGKPIVVVQMPRAPFDRKDGFGREFLPDCRTIQKAIDRLRGSVFFVQIGKGEALHKFSSLDLDLANTTSVTDAIDIGFTADAFIGQCSFIVPLAESLSKPGLFVWSRRGIQSPHEVVRQMTPTKILHRKSSRSVIDDCKDDELFREVDALCEPIRYPLAV